MVPLVTAKAELDLVKDRIDGVARAIEKEQGVTLSYLVGTMVELFPVPASMPARSAKALTSSPSAPTRFDPNHVRAIRDDAGRFLGEYAEGIIQHDPFVTLDPAVGELMWIAVERGRRSHLDLKIGICGEHGGDPGSPRFCEDINLDYVSCSPYRVPVARLMPPEGAVEAQCKSLVNHVPKSR